MLSVVSFTLGDFLVEPWLHRISKGSDSRHVEPKVVPWDPAFRPFLSRTASGPLHLE